MTDQTTAADVAQPQPQGPTDAELLELWTNWNVSWDISQGIWTPVVTPHPAQYARAVLARWGCPAIEPVPVAERLPGPEDCNAEGMCWLGGEMFTPGDPTWVLGFPVWAERFPEVHRFWLPAHALPVLQ
jgi:hypothetical protein